MAPIGLPSPRRLIELRELDEVTLARAKAGEASARAALIERYQRPVFKLLWRMVGRERAVVEDLAQETFLRALEALPRFDTRGPARLVTWILTIATRLALDHLRASAPRADVVWAPGSAPAVLPGPEQDADRHALRRALEAAVEELPPAFRAAFLLREAHDLSYEEIAEALDIDLGTVKSRLARARGLLQAALAELHDG
jgi:RNA polymerase sigma-70 factor (ECF subfamily)